MGIKDRSKVGSRGVIFTFEDDISVYLIETDQKWFLCDTHLGPESMEGIKKYILQEGKNKEVIVFNSHSDWDHIWGNCSFENGIIIGHETCRKRMSEIGEFDLRRLSEHHCGLIKLVLPNITFNDKITFPEEEIEFIYAPGHTVDSSICFDKKDSVLFVGDLVEWPIPYLDFHDLPAYSKTLEYIKNFPARVKISSHSGIVDNELIEGNIAYVNDIFKGNVVDPAVYQGALHVHTFNLNNQLFLKYEGMIRRKLGDKFNYALFRKNFKDLDKISYAELQNALDEYNPAG